MPDLVCLKTFTTRSEAEIAAGLLASHGIKSAVTSDDEGGASPFPFRVSATGVKLLINPKNLSLSKKILAFP
jgi:hypothetical protein